MTNQPKFPVGTQFQTRGKVKKVCTVVDIYLTYNSKGKLVKIAYIASHDFLGRAITGEYPETSVAMGLIKE